MMDRPGTTTSGRHAVSGWPVSAIFAAMGALPASETILCTKMPSAISFGVGPAGWLSDFDHRGWCPGRAKPGQQAPRDLIWAEATGRAIEGSAKRIAGRPFKCQRQADRPSPAGGRPARPISSSGFEHSAASACPRQRTRPPSKNRHNRAKPADSAPSPAGNPVPELPKSSGRPAACANPGLPPTPRTEPAEFPGSASDLRAQRPHRLGGN